MDNLALNKFKLNKLHVDCSGTGRRVDDLFSF